MIDTGKRSSKARAVSAATRQVRLIQRRLQHTLDQPYHYSGHSLNVTASIGVLYSDGQLTADSMLEHADKAMYQEKQRKHALQLAVVP
ncbi:diguanylate cyclase domain-containing protein [Alishewanella longhuensis]